jgi:hypothetical protein
MAHRYKILSLAVLMTLLSAQVIGAEEEPTQPVQNPDQFLLYGDFLWWKADANDVPLAVKETASASSVTVTKKTIELDGKWEPGFRVGAGYRFGFYDELDLLLTYTRFHGESKNVSVTADNIETPFLRQNWITFLGPIAFYAQGQWKVHLDVGDMEIGRKYDVTSHLSFRPHAGVRLAWLDFKYSANYTGVWIDSEEDLVTQNTSMSASSDFNSGGLRLGSGFSWNFCDNLGFFGDLSASLLYGHFKVNETFNGGDTVETGSLVSVTEKFNHDMNGVRVNVEALFGLKGWVDFNEGQSRFSLFAGYELSEWFRVNELFQVVRSIDPNDNATFSTIYSSNNIGFQGLTVKAGFDF